MSQAARTSHVWTYADYARLPKDGNRYEVLVTPTPSTLHQHIAGNLYIALREYVGAYDLGYVLFHVDHFRGVWEPKRHADVFTRRPRTAAPALELRLPDVLSAF